ncbi:MAG: hypothetical protein NTV97_20120 [Alphaproteobacteria bacterium]|nr:hypothetical protein [Alphaproteobacteria bacterium]
MSTEADIDGRHARSARTRRLIVEAFIALMREKREVPTAAEIAKRARYSVRSVFERFADFTELAVAAFQHVAEQGFSTPVGDKAAGDRPTRLEFHVSVRARSCEKWLPLWRLLMQSPYASKALAPQIDALREASRARISLMYRPELETLPAPRRKATLIAIEALIDFESWGRMREHHGLSFEEAREVWISMIDQLLPPTPKAKRRAA